MKLTPKQLACLRYIKWYGSAGRKPNRRTVDSLHVAGLFTYEPGFLLLTATGNQVYDRETIRHEALEEKRRREIYLRQSAGDDAVLIDRKVSRNASNL